MCKFSSILFQFRNNLTTSAPYFQKELFPDHCFKKVAQFRILFWEMKAKNSIIEAGIMIQLVMLFLKSLPTWTSVRSRRLSGSN